MQFEMLCDGGGDEIKYLKMYSLAIILLLIITSFCYRYFVLASSSSVAPFDYYPVAGTSLLGIGSTSSSSCIPKAVAHPHPRTCFTFKVIYSYMLV